MFPTSSEGTQPRETLPRLLTVVEVAQCLGLSRSKVYELLAAGTIRSVTIDRSRRVPLQALHAYIEHLSLQHAAETWHTPPAE